MWKPFNFIIIQKLIQHWNLCWRHTVLKEFFFNLFVLSLCSIGTNERSMRGVMMVADAGKWRLPPAMNLTTIRRNMTGRTWQSWHARSMLKFTDLNHSCGKDRVAVHSTPLYACAFARENLQWMKAFAVRKWKAYSELIQLTTWCQSSWRHNINCFWKILYNYSARILLLVGWTLNNNLSPICSMRFHISNEWLVNSAWLRCGLRVSDVSHLIRSLKRLSHCLRLSAESFAKPKTQWQTWQTRCFQKAFYGKGRGTPGARAAFSTLSEICLSWMMINSLRKLKT